MTPQILVQTHTKSTLRPSRIWTRCSTVKYREILDASQKGEFVITCPGSQPNFHFWCLLLWQSFLHEYVGRVMLTWVQRFETRPGLYKINRIFYENPATPYGHLESNVVVDLILMFRVASRFLWILNFLFPDYKIYLAVYELSIRRKIPHNGLKIIQNYKELSLPLRSRGSTNVTLRHCWEDIMNWEEPTKRTYGRIKTKLGTGE